MTKRSKKYREAAEKIDKSNLYSPAEAIALIKSMPTYKFDESIEAVYRLNVDPRQADQLIRGTVNLPNGTGKTVRVAVFARGPQAQAAAEAGADIVGDVDLVKKVQGGELDFDAVVATPDMMGQVGRLGRILGPRGLMPNPRNGTVTMDTAKAVKEIKAGKISFRVDKNGNLSFLIGKVSFDQKALEQNYAAVSNEIKRLRPSTVKGRYISKATLAATMSPGVPLDINQI
jgi:large subunit ribosomal protein L1